MARARSHPDVDETGSVSSTSVQPLCLKTQHICRVNRRIWKPATVDHFDAILRIRDSRVVYGDDRPECELDPIAPVELTTPHLRSSIRR